MPFNKNGTAPIKPSDNVLSIGNKPIGSERQGTQMNPSKPLQIVPPIVAPKDAEVWVKKWVDYSSKYGLGYLLSNQSTGVFFNDSTKILISPDGHTFNYYERKSSSSGGGSEK